MGTIKVPVNLYLISDRLPIANYDNDKRQMNRQVSMPSVTPAPQLTANVIKKTQRDEILRSADQRKTKNNIQASQEIMHLHRGQTPITGSNRAIEKVSNEIKENLQLPPLQRRPLQELVSERNRLQRNGAAVMGSKNCLVDDTKKQNSDQTS